MYYEVTQTDGWDHGLFEQFKHYKNELSMCKNL